MLAKNQILMLERCQSYVILRLSDSVFIATTMCACVNVLSNLRTIKQQNKHNCFDLLYILVLIFVIPVCLLWICYVSLSSVPN